MVAGSGGVEEGGGRETEKEKERQTDRQTKGEKD